jgi:uncharacterized membrane protein
MRQVLLRLTLVVAAGIGMVLLVGAILPREFAIEQEVDIAAPRPAVFAQVNDLHRWLTWSPWRAEVIGAERIQIGEPASGEGAKMLWEDPRGQGKLWLTQSDPPSTVAYNSNLAQFQGIRGEFRLAEIPSGTRVTWTSQGRLPGGPFYGYFRYFFGAEMERQFQASLHRLKADCEAAGATAK